MTAPDSGPDAGPVKPLPPESYVRMAFVLRVGLGAALAILGGSLVGYLLVHPGESSSSILSANPILGYLSLQGLAAGLASGSLPAFLTLGLAVLVATPIVRVLSGFYYFRRAGERTMSAITMSVMLLILVGIFVIGPLVH